MDKNDLLSLFEPYRLDDVLLKLNRICVAWERRELHGHFPAVASLPAIRACEYSSAKIRWAAGEAARFSVCCSRIAPSSSDPLLNPCTDAAVAVLVRAAMDLQSTEPHLGSAADAAALSDDHPMDIVERVFGTQFLMERESPYRLGQAILLYGDSARRRKRRCPQFDLAAYETALADLLGCDLQTFLTVLLIVLSLSRGKHPWVSTMSLVPFEIRAFDRTPMYRSTQGPLIVPQVTELLRAMSATPSTMQKWMQDELLQSGETDLERTIFKAPNPLLRFPLVQVFGERSDCLLAPVPSLITDWLYEPLVELLYRHVDKRVDQGFAQVFEEYVGTLLELCSPGCPRPWIYEDELKVDYSGNLVDWAYEFDDVVLLVEAKRSLVDVVKKYTSARQQWESRYKRWAAGIKQATKFWSSVQRGEVGRLHSAIGKPAVVVVVTQGAVDLRAGSRFLQSLVGPYLSGEISPLPFVVVSIDRLERVLAAWSHKDINWLAEVMKRAACSPQGSSHVLRPEERDDGPLLELGQRFVESICAASGAVAGA